MRRSSAGVWSLRAVDTGTERDVLRWQGLRIGRLLAAHPLLWAATEPRALYCSKAFIRQLALDKAAIDLADEMPDSGELVPAPPTANSAVDPDFPTLDRTERTLAALLKSRPGIHYSIEDVECLLTLSGYPVTTGRVAGLLGSLARKQVLQEIEVPGKRRFYDCDTRPHLHVYHPEHDALYDAVATGVLNSTALTGTILGASDQPVVVRIEDA